MDKVSKVNMMTRMKGWDDDVSMNADDEETMTDRDGVASTTTGEMGNARSAATSGSITPLSTASDSDLSVISSGLFQEEEADRLRTTLSLNHLEPDRQAPVGNPQINNLRKKFGWTNSKYPSMVKDSELPTIEKPLPRATIVALTNIPDEWQPALSDSYHYTTEFPATEKNLKQYMAFKDRETGLQLLYKKHPDGKLRLCIPSNCKKTTMSGNTPSYQYLREALLKNAHTLLGHPGTQKQYEYLSEYFHWPRMYMDSFDYCRQCDSCQHTKTSTQLPQSFAKPLSLPNQPFSHLSMDFLSLPPKSRNENGIDVIYDKLWVIVERFSCLKELIEIPKGITAPGLITLFLNRYYKNWGLPDDIVTDRDPLFTSKEWTQFCADNQIVRSMSTSDHPRTDGQTEVANKQVLSIIRNMVDSGNTNWLENLALIQVTLNRSIDASRKAVPFTTIYGYPPKLMNELGRQIVLPQTIRDHTNRITKIRLDAQRNLVEARKRQSAATNKRRRAAPLFNIGDKVLLSTQNLPLATAHTKTAPRFVGPFKVIHTQHETDNYTLDLPAEYGRIHPVFHVGLLKAYIENDDTKFPSRTETRPGPLPEFQDENRYEVDKILARRILKDGSIQYKVKWVGWGNETTWEPAENLETDTIEEFDRRTSGSITKPARRQKTRKRTSTIRKRQTAYALHE